MPPAAPPAFILGNKPGTINIRVSGTEQILCAWIDEKKNVWAQMPLPPKLRVKTISKFQIIELEGITQVVTPLSRSSNSPDKLKQQGLEILKRLKLTASSPASGVMFVSRKDGNLKIDPVVWVRDIKTLFYETACASGTTAIGIIESIRLKRSIKNFPILQPSGTFLLLSVKLIRGKPVFAEIGGPIEIIKKIALISPRPRMKKSKN